MKFATIVISATIALTATTLHAAATAKQILERDRTYEANCGNDERGTVSELKLISGAELKKYFPWADAPPKSKHLLVISTLSPEAAKAFGQPTIAYAEEVNANAKLEEFKPLIGTPNCHTMGF